MSTRPGQINVGNTRVDAKIDHDKYDIQMTGMSHWQNFNDATRPSVDDPHASISRDIWNGDRYFNYTAIADDSFHRIGVSPDGAVAGELKARAFHNHIVEMPNSILLGVFPGDDILLTESFRDLRPGDLTIGSDVLDGFKCDVVKAKSPYGEISVWIDSTHGCLVKLTLHKVKGDKYGDQTFGHERLPIIVQSLKNNHLPSSPESEMTFELDNCKLGQVGGIWLVASATETRTTKYSGGESDAQRFDYHLISADFATDFNKNPIAPDFPEGAEVRVEGDNGAIAKRWHNGQIVPAVDEELRKKLDQEVEDALKQKGQK